MLQEHGHKGNNLSLNIQIILRFYYKIMHFIKRLSVFRYIYKLTPIYILVSTKLN